MRQGQQSKRMRGRSRKGPNPLTRSYESNGPDVKIRGTALHIAEKYAQLARDAQASGDRVHSENLLQHAEHYFRIVAAAQAQMPQPQQNFRNDGDSGDEEEYRGNGHDHDRQQGRPDGQPNRQQDDQPAFGLSDPQPYLNGNGEDRSEGEAAGRGEETQPEQAAREQGDSGGSSRSRRRRPYRDRSADQNNQPPQASAPAQAEEAAEAPAGDD
jgi:Domain of unknown function (DUF4167)